MTGIVDRFGRLPFALPVAQLDVALRVGLTSDIDSALVLLVLPHRPQSRSRQQVEREKTVSLCLPLMHVEQVRVVLHVERVLHRS